MFTRNGSAAPALYLVHDKAFSYLLVTRGGFAALLYFAGIFPTVEVF